VKHAGFEPRFRNRCKSVSCLISEAMTADSVICLKLTPCEVEWCPRENNAVLLKGRGRFRQLILLVRPIPPYGDAALTYVCLVYNHGAP
jgi:hypothetical protein